ncbi:MAG: hypothetical protein Q7S09_02110 [bacterium]|nr:hypothetical protein [bacterium]
MPTISKDLAEREIVRLKKQKRPKVYCIVRYQNRLKGDGEKIMYSDYAICYKREHYDSLMRSGFIGGIDVLWASEKFKTENRSEEMDEGDIEDYLLSDEFIKSLKKKKILRRRK